MKLLLIFAASAMSATLVLPTVTQAESGGIAQRVAAAAQSGDAQERQA